ncbi:MAG TPA: biotin--[acetyl-CoA-carboxylase] ligase [Hyphomicrobiales bacterium]|nr:biotin--[acetyl-CoA-carboxylase] ligase [Hyphomicrobiales bacterium]
MAAFALGRDAEAAGYRLLALDEVGSTSAIAREHGRAGERGPLWVVAERQTAGHGRRGRAWQSPAGNLAASLLVVTDAAPAEAATLGFAAGLALYGALATLAPALARQIALKWPNDVLADGAKLAGILVEAEKIEAPADLSPPAGRGRVAKRPGEGASQEETLSAPLPYPDPLPASGEREAGPPSASSGARGDVDIGQHQVVAVIGFGVNIAVAPAGLPYPATSLAALGADVSATALFAALADAWVPLMARWERGGFASLRRDWLGRAMGLGGPLAATLRGEAIGGIFETIDEAGRLVLRGGDGALRTIAAGEVHFGDAAATRVGEGG